MNQVSERKRLRREYLKKKGQAYISYVTAGAVFVPLLLITVALALTALALLAFSIIQIFTRSAEYGKSPFLLFGALFFGMLAMVPGMFTSMCWVIMTDAKRDASIPHVPPVTASTLPAEEILVRAAGEPTIAQSNVLLRAAQDAQETPKEELLRVSQGE